MVPGFEGRYEVSDRGRVRALRFTNGTVDKRLATPRLLNPWMMPRDRYLFVTLCHRGKMRHCGVHVLVLLAFVGPRPVKHAAAHLDGSRTNNELANLVWATYRENESHKKGHGRAPIGSRNPFALLKEANVAEIRSLRSRGRGRGSRGRRLWHQ